MTPFTQHVQHRIDELQPRVISYTNTPIVPVHAERSTLRNLLQHARDDGYQGLQLLILGSRDWFDAQYSIVARASITDGTPRIQYGQLFTRLRPDAQRWVLAHELGHIVHLTRYPLHSLFTHSERYAEAFANHVADAVVGAPHAPRETPRLAEEAYFARTDWWRTPRMPNL